MKKLLILLTLFPILAYGATQINLATQVKGTLATANGGTGNASGNAPTATALAANGANCSAGNYPLGVDASGAVESCTAVPSGSATTSTIGALINGAGAATPNDTDSVATEDTSLLKKITWANVKAFLKTYFDTIYQAAGSYITASSTDTLTNKTLTSPTITNPTITGTLAGDILSLTGTSTGGWIRLVQPAAGAGSGITTASYNSGYSSTAIGDLVYLDASGTWQKAQANSATTSTNLLGVALTVAASGAAVEVALPGSLVCIAGFPTLTIGAPVYISDASAGAIVVTQPSASGDIIRIIGHATTAACILFNPDNTWITHA